MSVHHINDKLVKRLFGFELLVASYTIAHLKLSLSLQAQGWKSDERLHIYLTNTLEEPVERTERLPFAEFISDEANAAVAVKRDEPLLVILGNPPYPQKSANPSRIGRELTFIGKLIEDYKPTDGKLLGIKDQKKFLQADYVKFIRWAQWRIDKNGEGVIGYIVNNNFLRGPTFRRMRQSLMKSFNAIYCFNLHGGSRIGEIAPEAERDENVFDITQGVTILLCVKEPNNPAPAKIYYTDLWGSRTEKYNTLSETDVQTNKPEPFRPRSPYYYFILPKEADRVEYEKESKKITDIFQKSSIGILTARDRLTIHWTPEEVDETVTDFVSLSVDEARKKYDLREDSQDWKVHLAQADLRNHPDAEQHIQSINYRPYDTRWTYYTGQSKGFHCAPRRLIMRHLQEENLALCTHRSLRSATTWQHVFVTNRIIDGNCLSTKDGPTHVFPLYRYPDPDELGLATEPEINFKPEFLKAFSEALALPQTKPFNLPQGVSPEEIRGYVYAVLYSPDYREKYYEFLKNDFPRIPLPRDIENFRQLAGLGQRLINCHLLKDTQALPQHRFEGEGDAVVVLKEVRYEGGHVWINPTQYFTGVSEAVWNYEIGAYQVCEKWLKDRRGNVLSHAEVRQYCQILVVISETLRIMRKIDEGLDF